MISKLKYDDYDYQYLDIVRVAEKLNQVIDTLNARESEEPEKSEREYCCRPMELAINDGYIEFNKGIYTAFNDDDMWSVFDYCPFCGTRLEG